MANFPDFFLPMSGMPSSFSDVDTIWEMGSSTLLQTNNQLLVPERLAVNLSDAQIMELKSRLSQFCGGAQTVAMRDAQSNGLRICCLSDYQTPSMETSASASPVTSSTSPSPASTASAPEEEMANHLRSPGKKSKVPRPPNAFILYRKKHHPQLKVANPDMHNNEISVILGKQWNNESDSVKATYRHMAEKIKRKHAEDNPGYQYAPRKPSEKKRRMTARKLAAQRADEIEQELQFFPVSDMVEVADHERSTSEGVTAAEENAFTTTDDIFRTSPVPLTYAPAWTGDSGPSPSADLFRIDDDTLDVSVTLPAPQQQLQQQVGAHYDGVNGLLPFDPRWLSTAPAPQLTNEQDFLNSLIDWEGIQQDVNAILESTAEERDDLTAAETGTSRLLSWDAMSPEDFQKELDRIMKMI